MTTPSAVATPRASPARRLAAALYRRPRVQVAALLAAPLGWLVIAYLGSLALFLVSSFWSVDSLSGNIITTRRWPTTSGSRVARSTRSSPPGR